MDTTYTQLEDWEAALTKAINEPDPAQSNYNITLMHYRLSQQLQHVIGADAGANFHSWAVWGSRKAGVTIRQEDLDSAIRNAFVIAGLVGAGVGMLAAWLLWLVWLGLTNIPFLFILLGGCLLGAGCGAYTGRAIAIASRRRAAQLILDGNRFVLQDIGRQTARFIVTCSKPTSDDSQTLETFLTHVHNQTTQHHTLLEHAFRLYWEAKNHRNEAAKHQAMYVANCLAVLHEHLYLDRFIKGSMPWIIRKCVTKRMLSFDVGTRSLAVNEDISAYYQAGIPSTLTMFDLPLSVQALFADYGVDPVHSPITDSPAKDWTNISQRMRYIFPLFRALHLDSEVYTHPYQNTSEIPNY